MKNLLKTTAAAAAVALAGAAASANTIVDIAAGDARFSTLVAAVRAKQAGAEMSICLINDPTLVPLLDALNVDAYINPRATTVSSILRHVRHGRVRGVYSIGDAEAEIIEAQVLSTSPIAGKPIRDIDLPEGALIGAVRKGKEVIRPDGATVLEDGDLVVSCAMSGDVPGGETQLQVSVDYF